LTGSAPACIALILCHEVIVDERTKNKSVIGIFNHIFAHSVPTIHPRVAVLASLTDGRGISPIDLFWSNETTQKLGFRMSGNVDFSKQDARSVVDLVFDLPGLPIDGFGQFVLEVKSGDAVLSTRRVLISGPNIPIEKMS